MAEGEEEVNYASGVFKAGNNPPPAAKRGEETVYVEVKVQNETKNEGEETVYDNVKVQNETKNEDSAGHRRFQHLACCSGILCVILLGGIIGVCVYLANLTRDNKNLTDQFVSLTQAYTVSESKVENLSAEVQELNKLNQELETQKKNLKQKIQDMTTNWNELNVSRAQWSIDSYCLGNKDDKCQPCQHGWKLTQPSCYVYNDAPSSGLKTWEEARGDCSGKNSDLAVVRDSEEKEAIITNRLRNKGFWIGLRVEDGKWKWVDGSNLIDSYWIDHPADGHCALFYTGRNGWSSVSCEEKKQWICQKKALTLSV
ncbi:C-type lectin domain family 12 member B-like [Gymnodraco acuticeps]|uniref:C-type lectin domain family 12 member B-like n=1 Tax=Gymnodraco acuticeps TaxID=8218 RepID=A0A6P8UMW3_GYMAC|nr:C-type lectin domain family 12 member B-like [Gymnodraco acuticeps]